MQTKKNKYLSARSPKKVPPFAPKDTGDRRRARGLSRRGAYVGNDHSIILAAGYGCGGQCVEVDVHTFSSSDDLFSALIAGVVEAVREGKK